MYLIVEGKVQTIKRKKPQLGKRVSRLNATAFNFGSHDHNPLNSRFNSKSLHNILNNLQLKEF